MKTSGFIKLVVALIVAVVIALLVVQMYNYFFLAIKTEYAVKATMEDSFEVSGIVCRNEYFLNKETGGYYDITLENGSKVSKGGTIASVYSKEEDVKAKEQIRMLQAQIDEYNAAVSVKSSYSGDSSVYEQNIQSALSDYAGALQNRDSFSAQDALESFEKQVLIKEIISGENTDYQQIILQLQSQIETLEASIGGGVQNVAADRSGFFTTEADGFESTVTAEKMSELTPSDYNALYAKIAAGTNRPENLLGKIVLEYSSDFYFVAPSASMKDYEVGDTIYLRFPSVSDEKIKCQVISLTKEEDDVLVGVSCAKAHAGLFSSRIVEASVITKTYSGIRVDKESIRIVDGENGVYTKVGSIVKFKKVNILYMGTTYALVEESTGGIVNFDEIIVGGRDIYDGKIIS